MFRCLRLLASASASVALLAAAAAPLAAAEQPADAAASSTTSCASAAVSGYSAPSAPEPGHPCWVDVKPYPFGSYEGPSGTEEAGPVEIESPRWREEHPQCLRFGLERLTGDAAAEEGCFLTVTSMAFRSWNHGLAATYPASLWRDGLSGAARAEKNPYGVWIFDYTAETGPQWFPDPTFPGRKACPGHTIVWAGKLDYWLVGGPTDRNWSRLCRFDGLTDQWQPFAVPAATLRRVTPPVIPPTPATSPRAAATTTPAPISDRSPREGGITSAACLAWSDCWFFGSYGAVLYWNGSTLTDASPAPTERWLDGEYLAAATNEDPVGDPFAVAVSGTAEYLNSQSARERELIPARPSAPGTAGSPPPELFRSLGWEFTFGLLGGSSALPFSPPTDPQDGAEEPGGATRPVDPGGWKDPYRTDLVAVGFNEAAEGWVAGNPAGLRTNWECEDICGEPAHRQIAGAEALAPLVPVSLSSGTEDKCTDGPFAPEKLTFSDVVPPKEFGSFLWSSLAVVPAVGEAQLPASGEAVAGGSMRPHEVEGSERNSPGTLPEPVIVQANCDGAMTTTRFRVAEAAEQTEPNRTEAEAADRGGTVTAISASAKNDAWAATSDGQLLGRVNPSEPPMREKVIQAPHLYQLTDGRTPEALEGNEEEERPPELQENPPIYVFEPEPEPPLPPVPPPVTNTSTTHEPPAVFGVKATLHNVGGKLSLYLSFKLRRPITLGAEALRSGRVVARAKARHFSGRRGVLVLQLSRKHWPTKIRFTS